MTSVQETAATTCLRPTWKSAAMAVRQKVSRKKSKASKVQPRKQAEKVLRWTRVRARNLPRKGIAECYQPVTRMASATTFPGGRGEGAATSWRAAASPVTGGRG